MTERSALTQVVQLGVESVEGTAVAATVRLASMSIKPSPEMNVRTYTPAGQKYATTAVQHTEWAMHQIDGIPTYDEIVYALCSVLETATPSTPVGATNARLWAFTPSSTAPDTTTTYTMEKGDSNGCHDFAGLKFTGLEFDIAQDDVSISGAAISKALVAGQSLAAGAAQLELVPIARKHISVYLDTSFATIGNTKLTRAFTAKVGISDRFGPVVPIDRTQGGGYAATVETTPTANGSFLLACDATGEGHLTNLRDGDTLFMRVECIGGEIEAGFNYQLTWDCAIQLTNVNTLDEHEGVYVIGFDFTMATDDDMGAALSVEVQNAVDDLTPGAS